MRVTVTKMEVSRYTQRQECKVRNENNNRYNVVKTKKEEDTLEAVVVCFICNLFSVTLSSCLLDNAMLIELLVVRVVV